MGSGISKRRESSVTCNHSSHYSHKRSKSKRKQKLKLERYWIYTTDARLVSCSIL